MPRPPLSLAVVGADYPNKRGPGRRSDRNSLRALTPLAATLTFLNELLPLARVYSAARLKFPEARRRGEWPLSVELERYVPAHHNALVDRVAAAGAGVLALRPFAFVIDRGLQVRISVELVQALDRASDPSLEERPRERWNGRQGHS